jgi:hypothetical protein
MSSKWHLAHTSWFFETFVLSAAMPGYRPFHPQFSSLFNSYYNAVGERHCRPKRGLISRPTVEETYRYRAYVDQHMVELLENADADRLRELSPLVTLGLHHEQQHQELMLTDIKHVFTMNPLRPVYRERSLPSSHTVTPPRWVTFPEGIYWIGHEGEGFSLLPSCSVVLVRSCQDHHQESGARDFPPVGERRNCSSSFSPS